MTDTAYETSHAPLGVGRIVGDTFSILFRKLPAILLLGFVPALIELFLGSALTGQTASQINATGEMRFDSLTAFLVVFLVSLVITSVVTAAIIQLSYDAKLNRPAQLGRYISAAIRNLPAIVVLSIVSTILCTLAGALLLLPGLWLYAVFSVFVPAIVIERAGFRALGRSAELTKNYRWPIVGALVLVFLCMILLMIVVGTVTVLVASALPSGVDFIAMIFDAVGSAVGYGMISVAAAMIFARLKEIKEGVSVDDLVEVFK